MIRQQERRDQHLPDDLVFDFGHELDDHVVRLAQGFDEIRFRVLVERGLQCIANRYVIIRPRFARARC